MLELQNISYVVNEEGKDIEILKDINIKIDGRFTAITGPNGGGKSTLAKMIAGIITPTSGKIILDGEDITGCCRINTFRICCQSLVKSAVFIK